MAYTFISGATGGIGKAFCIACAKKGYNLFLTGRSEQKLSKLKSELLSQFNVQIQSYACQLNIEDERNSMISYIKQQGFMFNRIINVAGVDIQKPIMDYSMEKLLFQMRVNVEATICLTHALLSFRQPQAQVITIASMSGVSPMPYFALYSATKAMLINFFTSLHYELKREGVKVTVVMPGGVPTRKDIIDQIKEQGLWGRLSSKMPEFIAEKSLKMVNKNKIKYIPGAFNKILYFTMKLLPKRLTLKFIARRWSKIQKDAF